MEEKEIIEKPAITTEEDTPRLSKEEINLIKKGIRPDGMDFETFKMIRKINKRIEKQHLKGVLSFKSISKEEKQLGIKGKTYKKEK